jgi:hypothetical protein
LNNNNPLVIIDGMEASLDAVNPNDIESISILKMLLQLQFMVPEQPTELFL